MFKDAIAAISTPPGWGGIGIVRISGKDAFKIIEKIFNPVKPYKMKDIKTHTIRYGHIIDNKSGQIIDEVLVSFFREPNTYTREDIAEINCHGGALIVKKILEIVIENGARVAEPGEFTKRAFLNGRIDLSQAEAVIDVINSKTNAARKASINQLEGKLSEKIRDIRGIFIESIADIEVSIDYPEYDIEEVSRNKLLERMRNILYQLEKLTKTFFEGRIIAEGIDIAIIGKPNVGKSSLLNALSQKEKAIITEIPGTTRDIIEEVIEIGGILVRILDTAGLRETNNIIEKIGINKTKKLIEKADLILLVLDGSEPINSNDRKIFEIVNGKKIIIIINKSDLVTKLNLEEIKKTFGKERIIEISAKEEVGLEKLEEAFTEMFFMKEFLENQLVVTNIRHKDILNKVKDEVLEIINSLNNNTPIDIVSVSIVEAANILGEITGETVSQDVLHSIFSKFCIGK